MCQPLVSHFRNVISFNLYKTLQIKHCYHPYLACEEISTQRGELVCQFYTDNTMYLWDLNPPTNQSDSKALKYNYCTVLPPRTRV